MSRSNDGKNVDRFEQIAKLAEDGIWTLDADGRTDFINERGASMLGYTVQELIGRSSFDPLFPDRVRSAELLSDLKAGKAHSGETSFLRGDGTMVLVRFRLHPLFDDHGRYGGAVSMFTDITELKKIDKGVKESEDRFRSVLDSSLDAIYRFSLQTGRYEYVSPAFERVVGRSVEEMSAQNVEEAMSWIYPDDLPGVHAALDRLSRYGAAEYDYRLKGRDGRYRWISNHLTLVRDDAGRPLYRDGVIRDVTRQKDAEEALRESEARYRALFENIYEPVVLWRLILDERGEIIDRELVDANPAALKALNASSVDEVRGKKDSEISRPADAARVLDITRRVMGTGKPVVDEAHFDNADRDYLTNYAPLGEDHIISTSVDITNLKRAEREAAHVRQKNELFAVVASKLLASDDPQAIVDDLALRTMRFLGCDFFFNYFKDEKRGGLILNAFHGISDEETKGMSHLNLGAAVCGLVALEGRRMIVGSIQARDDDRTSFHRAQGMQAYACHPLIVEGETIGTLSFGTRVRNAFDEDEMSVMKNVADQIAIAMKRIMDSRAMVESEQRLRMATEAADMFTLEYDVRTREIRFSDNYSSVIGCPPPATLDEMIQNIHPDDRKTLLDARARAERDGWDRVDYEYRSYVDPLHMRWLHAWNSLIRDDSGLPDRVISITQDVTERRRAEEELRRSNAELQHFAYISSHDLQEPLRMVTMFTDLLGRHLGEGLDPQSRTYMNYISEGATRMRSLISDLLAYSRVDAQPLEVVEFDLDKTVGDVISDLSVPIAEANAEVIVHPLPVVAGDELKIRQVLQNIISNGIKFNRSGRPTVEVSAQRLATEAIIAVKDNGIGIDPKHQDKIFEMFQRLHTREEYPGTGVGLAIARKIVEQHGGRIWFEPEPGRGSTFYFTLPLHPQGILNR